MQFINFIWKKRFKYIIDYKQGSFAVVSISYSNYTDDLRELYNVAFWNNKLLFNLNASTTI